MAIECLAEVINARRAPWRCGNLTVLIVLANYADPDGTNIFPATERIARAARMSDRAVQAAMGALLEDGVLILVREASSITKADARVAEDGMGDRKTREYRIAMDRVREFAGCLRCGGVVCGDDPRSFCGGHPRKDFGGPPKKTTRTPEVSASPHIRMTRHRPVNDSAGRAAPVDKSGGPRELWQLIADALGDKAAQKLAAFEAVVSEDGGALVLDFPRPWSRQYVGGLQRSLAASARREVKFLYAGKEAVGP